MCLRLPPNGSARHHAQGYPPRRGMACWRGSDAPVNRYVAEGVLADLDEGKNVLVLCADRGHIRSTMDNILAALPGSTPPGLKVRYANGAESIAFDGARITFSSYGSSLRGASPDVIVMDGSTASLGDDWWFEFNHALAVRA